MQENKNKYYDIAERIYDLDGEVYECVGSSLGRTFTGDKRTCVDNLVMLMRTKPQGHLLRSELALISNMARTIRKDEDRSRLMKKYDEILKEIAELPASFGKVEILDWYFKEVDGQFTPIDADEYNQRYEQFQDNVRNRAKDIDKSENGDKYDQTEVV